MQQSSGRHGWPHTRWKSLLIAVFAIYLLGGAAFGYVFFREVESAFAIDLLAGTPSHLSIVPPDLVLLEEPPPQPERPTLQPLPENPRITVLLMGIDLRDDEVRVGVAGRSDSMLLATVDPSTGTGGLLTIPRDLWVTIPATSRSGERYDRINTANFWGDYEKSTGGGPVLAKRAIERNFGVKVQYFARVNFHGFERVIDTLGGIDVNVPKYIYDEEYPDDDYGFITVSFSPGPQHMSGTRALQYARTRHQDNDFGRTERQRQVLMAVRERALQLDALPKIPSLLGILGDSIQTDMPVAEMLRLANVVRAIDPSQVQSKAVDLSMTVPTITSGGADVLMPRWGPIAKLTGQLFFDPNLRQENPTVEVLNGADKPGLASAAADALTARGFVVSRVDTADRTDYGDTLVKSYRDKPYAIQTLAEILGVPESRIVAAPPTVGTADITVIIGRNAIIP